MTVLDLSFDDAEIGSTEAYLVTPASGAPAAGIVWFHWLESGAPTSNRTEFLDEARGLAGQGAASLLVQGTMPWSDPPTSIVHDREAVEREVRMLSRSVDLLASRPKVNAERIALVGHDFGAMYGAVLFGADPRVDALAMMSPTARWADWFVRYWSISDKEAEYTAAMAPLDPVVWLPEGRGRPVLLQFGSQDRYVPERVADEIRAAAGTSAEATTYDAGHELNDEARADRALWLARVLGLPPG